MHSYARFARFARPYCYCPLRGSKTYYKATYGLFVIRKKQSGKSPHVTFELIHSLNALAKQR
jgi:hypothetical protein